MTAGRRRITSTWRNRRRWEELKEVRKASNKSKKKKSPPKPKKLKTDRQKRRAYIESVRHTKEQLAQWGVSWPPQKYWKKRLILDGFPSGFKMPSGMIGSEVESSDIPTYTEDTLPPFSERAGVYHCQGSSVHPDDLEGGDWEPPFDVVDEVTAEFFQIIRG